MDQELASIATRFDPNPNIQNILITGAAGFIGSWLASHLVQQYAGHYNIIAYDNLCRAASLKNVRHLEIFKNFTFVPGDICNATLLLRTMHAHKIDTVMHLAAQTSVDDSYGNPIDSVVNNITGTHTLLECSRKVMVRRFIYMSTDEVYGPCGPEDIADESTVLRPTNPYSASKASGEMLVHSYCKSYRLPTIVVRSNNAYGPHQYPEKIIPKFSQLVHRGGKLTVMDKGLQSRCYLHVKDLINALDTILHKCQSDDFVIFNVSSSNNFTTLGIAFEILRASGICGEREDLFRQWMIAVPDRPFHDMHYFTKCDKLKALGWSEKIDFQTGLKMTVDWYRSLEDAWWTTDL
ncbi:NAD(P)-binding protein [Pseudovirgaria hyperparasitica]|uniref:NAD(P)-binding protein n=1 Tax=Pseudovirgaria hyperparasitica TaxID=470096 RepID=A0A6A6W2F6_9PEZI|nr:NAD(P)-binding protein [Pseudovirgaria hyperparasitica]KAF2756309.1 NAD(P)-binding protein [Pseudovirgaria hyperparasitica]